MSFTRCLRITFYANFLISRRIRTSPYDFAGHSKWANIKHIKAAKDGQRAVLFSRLVRQIRLAIQEGGSSNPHLNSTLRGAMDDAIRKNMPMATVQSTIKRFEKAKTQLKKYILEIKMINNPIYLVCILYADNVASLKMAMAPIVKKSGATFVDARHLFDDCGMIEAVKQQPGPDFGEVCMNDAIECGLEELEVIDEADGTVNFFCNPVELERISRDLRTRGYQIESAEHVFMPRSAVKVGQTEIEDCRMLRDKLKSMDGVDEIYDNVDGGT